MRSIAAILFALEAFIVCTVGSAAQPLPRSVLILNQSTPFGPWQSTIIATIRSTVNGGAAEPVTFYIEHLEFSRFKGQQYLDSLENHWREKYRDKPIGVVVAIGPVALDYALKMRAAFWPSVPIVFTAVEDTRVTQGSIPSNVTGVTMDQSLGRMIEAARIVVPKLKGFAIVGTRLEDQIYYRNFANDLPKFSRDLQFIDLMGLSIAETRQRVAALPEHTAIFYIGLNFYGSAAYVAAEVVPLIAERANRPIIVDAETFLGTGAVGGFILTPRQLGEDAGRLALRILQGADVSEIPITRVGPRKPIFDWRQLQRWQVDASRLPKDSEIRFREPHIWERYFHEILGISAAILIQTILIGWLFYEHWRRQRAEILARQSLAKLSHMNRVATAGQLSGSIAHEINQPLAAMVFDAQAALNYLSAATPNTEEVRAGLSRILSDGLRAGDIVKSAGAMFRHEAREKTRVDINKLILSVLALARIDLQDHAIVLDTELVTQTPTVVGNAVQFQQVILNLIMNAVEAMQSVQPRVLRIKSELRQPDLVHVSIEDTGTGIQSSDLRRIFDPLFTTKAQGMGMGLSICKSIIEDHKGRIWVSPGANRGSIFQFELPTANKD